MLVSVPIVKNQCVQRTWMVSWTYSWWSKISTNCCTWNLCEQWNYLYIKWSRIFCVNSCKLSRLPQLGKGSFFDAPFVDCGSTEFEVLQVDLKKNIFPPVQNPVCARTAARIAFSVPWPSLLYSSLLMALLLRHEALRNVRCSKVAFGGTPLFPCALVMETLKG